METVLNIDYGHRGLHSCIQLSKLIGLSLSLAFFEFSRRWNFARLFLTRAVSDTKFKDLKSCLTMQNQGSSFLSESLTKPQEVSQEMVSLFVLSSLVLQHKPHGLACPAPTPQHSFMSNPGWQLPNSCHRKSYLLGLCFYTLPLIFSGQLFSSSSV